MINDGTPRGLPPPSPVPTATYCRPSTSKLIGKPCTDVASRVSHKMRAVAHVDRLEAAVEIAHERHAAAGRQHAREERGALLQRPGLLESVDVECRELADVAVRARHLVVLAVGAAAAAAARLLLDRLRAQRHAALAERNEHLARRAVKAHRVPVLAASRARARVDPLTHFGVEDVRAIARRAGLAIEARPHVLEDRFDVIEVGAALAVVLPEDPVLADRQDPLVVARVDQHALEHDVEVEGLAGRVRVVPRELARARVERERRARIERDVLAFHPAARGHPWLRLRGAPVREIQIGIVASRDPALRTRAIQIRQVAPAIAAGLAARARPCGSATSARPFPGRRR